MIIFNFNLKFTLKMPENFNGKVFCNFNTRGTWVRDCGENSYGFFSACLKWWANMRLIHLMSWISIGFFQFAIFLNFFCIFKWNFWIFSYFCWISEIFMIFKLLFHCFRNHWRLFYNFQLFNFFGFFKVFLNFLKLFLNL